MIASENFAPVAVMQAQGWVLTNKYAEGYPGRRYYGGCEHVDVIEQLAIDRIKALFGAEYANVQPHSGAQANAAAMAALLKPGDTILGLDLAHGGHLTHGMRLNFSGQLYNAVAYHVRARRPPGRHGRGGAAGARAQAAADRRRLVGLPPAAGLRRVPADRRRGRRLPDGRHGPLRRPGRRRPAPLPRAARPRGHLHHPQDPRRPPRRRHPGHRRAGQEVQLLGVPRPAGRPARARHRGQGGVVQARRRAGVPRAAGAHPGRCPDPRRPAARRRLPARPGSTWSAAAPTCTWCWSTCASRRWTASRPRTGCTPSASPSTATRCRSTRGRRWSAPASASAPPRWPPAASTVDDFTEVADIIARALRPDARRDRARPGCGPGSPTLAAAAPALPGPGGGRPDEQPRAPPAPTCRTTRTSSGATPSPSARTTS